MLFVVANFAVLLAWYGLNTWLTQLMREMDYPLGSALQFTLVLNLGAVIGSFAIAAVADRIGPRFVTIGSAALSAVAVVGLTWGGNTAVVLCLTALAGVGAHSSLTVLNDWVASSYPASSRATALGYVSGFGRGGAIVAPLLGGWILTASLGPTTVFYVFAAAAALSAAALLAIPTAGPDAPPPSATPRLQQEAGRLARWEEPHRHRPGRTVREAADATDRRLQVLRVGA
ncbi:MFS transporter [Streptomyces sp. INA 01156]